MQTKILVSFSGGLSEDDSSAQIVSSGVDVKSLQLRNTRIKNGELVFDNALNFVEETISTRSFHISARLSRVVVNIPNVATSSFHVNVTGASAHINSAFITPSSFNIKASLGQVSLPFHITSNTFVIKVTGSPASLHVVQKLKILWKIQIGL